MIDRIETSRGDSKLINQCIFVILIFVAVILLIVGPSLFKDVKADFLFCSIILFAAIPIATLAIFFQAFLSYVEETRYKDVYSALKKCLCDLRENQKILLIGSIVWILLILLELKQEGISSEEAFIAVFLILFTACLILCVFRCSGYDDAEISCSQTLDKSIGALWAIGAYNSYYKIALESEEVGNFIVRCQAFEEETSKTIIVKKLLIICPLSCNVKGSLTDKDANISYVGELKPIEYDQGANTNRKYKQTVYGIKNDEGRVIHVVAECTSPLGVLWERRESMLEEKQKYHRDCFIKMLENCIPCQYAVILKYDDESPHSTERLSRFLLSSVENLLQDRNIAVEIV